MKLEESYLTALDELRETGAHFPFTNRALIPFIDLTLLDETAGSDAVRALALKANLHQVAAICVFPQHLQLLSPLAGIRLATVVNFPGGNQEEEQVLMAIENLGQAQLAHEIDYVFPYQQYLTGKKEAALKQCQHAYQLCKDKRLCFKVIMETGALTSLEAIYQLSREIIDRGCNFLKTSTGKIPQGASPAAAFAILKAIQDAKANCGLKVSGGIKKPEQAHNYMRLAQQLFGAELNIYQFRIGASSLLDDLVALN